MINDVLSKLPGFKHDFIYELIAYQELKLCLDVGAAAGIMTQKIKAAGSEETTVLAFEPFEGNHKYFLENTSSLKNVELIKKAVSNKAGIATFHIPSVVVGSEQGWEKMIGYSSVGALIKGKDKPSEATNIKDITVETVAIDELVDGHVNFMKIDVQGGEFEVLKGCENLLSKHHIDVMYIEFSGDANILNLLNSHHYSVFDTDYLLGFQGDETILQELGFYDYRAIGLSTGSTAYLAKLSLVEREFCSFLKEFSEKYGFIQTDLVCVSNSFLPQFINNLSQYIGSGRTNSPHNSTDVSLNSNKTNIFRERASQSTLPTELTHYKIVASEEKRVDQLAIGLIQRIANYYRRWPAFLAIIALSLNIIALLDFPVRSAFAAIGTAILLFLIGHAASKADYVLAELEDFKKRSSLSSSDTPKKFKKKKS